MEEIENKVAQSGLITLDLEKFYQEGERVEFDMADQLWEGLVLKEKDFRQFIAKHDFTQYQDKFVSLHCSADAIVPSWAYMLLTSRISPFAKKVIYGDRDALESILFSEALEKIDVKEFEDERLIVKGCSKKHVPVNAYLMLVQKLQPYVKSIMYGEPCSTVPVYKKPK